MQEIEYKGRQKMHKFFESFTKLPHPKMVLTIAQMDEKILQQNDDLYSLFSLTVLVRTQHEVAQKLLPIFRRLLTLIFCVSHKYLLYHSKIKTLTNFWWQACLKHKNLVSYDRKMQSNNNSNVELFRQSMRANQFQLYSLKCFNGIIFNLLENTQKIIVFTQLQQITLSTHFKSCIKILKNNLLDSENQDHYKTLLGFQYAKFLLFSIHWQSADKIKQLFSQFFQSIKFIIRLMKKFYAYSNKRYRSQLIDLIEKGYKKFYSLISNKKIKVLKTILEYLHRHENINQRTNKVVANSQIELKQSNNNNNNKIAIKLILRLLNQWKNTLQNKMIRAMRYSAQAPLQNSNLKQKSQIAKINTHQKLYQNLKTKRNLKLVCRKQIGKDFTSNQSLLLLKKKRAQSSKTFKQAQQSIFILKSEIKKEIQQRFGKLWTKRRSYSLHNNINYHKEEKTKTKQIELKIENYLKKPANKQHRILRLASRNKNQNLNS